MFQHITVEVHCHWTDTPPVYRIYVDNDLITERTFSWPGYQVYIKENIVCNVNPGEHTVKIENCIEHGTVELQNLHVEGFSVASPTGSKQFLKFNTVQ